MHRISYSFLFLAVPFLVTSCKSDTAPTYEVEQTVEKPANKESVSVDFVLPQFISLAKSFQAAGLTYESGKTNDTKNTERYVTQNVQLLNIGVYSTDLAYCALNGKSQEARRFFRAVQDLGNSAGLDVIFSDKELMRRFDENIAKQQDIEDFIYEIQEKSESYMQDNDLRHLSLIQFAGAWVEGMYLGAENSQLLESGDIAQALADQMLLLQNILSGLEDYPNKDAVVDKITRKFKEINETYRNFESVKVAGNNPNKSAPELTSSELAALKKVIRDTRTWIVQAN